jgi:hypothetical protein
VQATQQLGIPDVALAGMDHHDETVGTEEGIPVLEKGICIFVAHRQLLVEAGVHVQLAGEKGHDQGDEAQESQGGGTIGEEQGLQPTDQVSNHEREMSLPIRPCGSGRGMVEIRVTGKSSGMAEAMPLRSARRSRRRWRRRNPDPGRD